jgi:membrane protease YdiL (CAAX protease family)
LGFELISLVIIVAIAYGLVYWAYRGEKDRSARVGLYLVYGIPGTLLTVAGLALSVNGQTKGLVILAFGLGLVLPLLKPVRAFVATYTPFDPTSATDMSGLCVVLSITIGYFVLSLVNNNPEEVDQSVDNGYLIVQVAAYIALAYAAVGVGFRRTFDEATTRLGLRWPSKRTLLIAVGFVGIALVISAIASGLTAAIQPDVSDKIQQSLQNMTSDVQNPIGAIILGLSAGIGEEIFFRGALQPRFGIGLTSVLFAVLHTQYGFSVTSVGILGIGIMLGYERKKYGTPAAMTTHAIYNILSVLALTYT